MPSVLEIIETLPKRSILQKPQAAFPRDLNTVHYWRNDRLDAGSSNACEQSTVRPRASSAYVVLQKACHGRPEPSSVTDAFHRLHAWIQPAISRPTRAFWKHSQNFSGQTCHARPIVSRKDATEAEYEYYFNKGLSFVVCDM